MTNIRDPVHGFIELDDLESKVLNLGILQRLRGIRQLALASLVYPGALHTRFDHTLGVVHVAGKMADALKLNSDDRRLVRFAALLHDTGHGPFSHVSESALERFANRASLPSGQKKEKIHEVITGHFIKNHPALLHCLGQSTCNEVAQLLQSGYGDPVLKSIVSGPLDADKQDYLLRDNLFCGVDYGGYDIHQLQRSMLPQEVAGQKELMIQADGVHAVEQFVMAKYYMTTMVYRHKVRLITDQMIVRAIVLGIEKDNDEDLKTLYMFDNSEAFYGNYQNWNDALFFQKGIEGKNGKCADLLRRLVDRRLLKRIFDAPVKEFASEVKEKLRSIGKKEHSTTRTKIEMEIANVLKTENINSDSDLVILHSYQIKSVRESSKNDEASILVHKAGGNPGYFEEESVLFSSINERMSDEFVEVYAPLEWQNHAERKRILLRLRPQIKELLEKQLAPMKETLQ